MTVEDRLAKVESLLMILVERQQKDWYAVDEFARLVGRSAFTVRSWCRDHRLNAQKKASGRGAHASWVISHEELQRYRREGLLGSH